MARGVAAARWMAGCVGGCRRAGMAVGGGRAREQTVVKREVRAGVYVPSHPHASTLLMNLTMPPALSKGKIKRLLPDNCPTRRKHEFTPTPCIATPKLL